MIILSGDLGAGKRPTKGIAEGLEIDQMIKSPTYTIVREYEGRLPYTIWCLLDWGMIQISIDLMISYLEMVLPLLNGRADWAESLGCLSKNFYPKIGRWARVGFWSSWARAEDLLASFKQVEKNDD